MSNIVERHIPCEYCGSSDARSIYRNETDGSLWSVCFACDEDSPNRTIKVKDYDNSEDIIDTTTKDLKHKERWANAQSVSLPNRAIAGDVCNRYLVRVANDHVYFPYFDADGTLVGFKYRGVDNKQFYFDGSLKKATLFGQKMFPQGGTYVTIVEGEYDALAAHQMLGPKSTVVSVTAGAQSAYNDCKANYEWLDSFGTIILALDADEEGQKASKKIAELFVGKVKIVKLDEALKDANGYLLAGKAKGSPDCFYERWWNAEPYTPDGIVASSSLWDKLTKAKKPTKYNYPFEGLNKIVHGIREAELVTVTAGSGLGKSQFLKEILFNIFEQDPLVKIGCLFLEESTERSGLGLMSLYLNKPLHLPNVTYTDEEFKEAFDIVLGNNNFYFYDHFGSTAIDNLISRIKFLIKACDCRVIVLDHVSIVVSAQASGDERKAIDEIMTKLRQLVQETGVCMFVVSHLSRPKGQGHEEGAVTSLSQLRGSHSIAQLSDIVIGLERDGQAENDIERNTTVVRVLKNRFSGLTGLATMCYYNPVTGRMYEQFLTEKEAL